MRLQPDDNTYDTSDTEGESGTWYWNESANESDSDKEEEGYSDVDDDDESRTEESRTQEEARLEVNLMDIRWNRNGARDSEREASQIYNIEALCQNLGLDSAANSQIRPGEPSQSLPNNSVSSRLFSIRHSSRWATACIKTRGT